MSYLKQFSRRTNDERKGKMLSVRINEELHNSFTKHCKELGLSVSEGVTLLLEREVGSNTDV